MLRLTLTVRAAHESHDLLIEAGPRTTLRELLPELSGFDQVYIGPRAVPLDCRLDHAGLRDGAVLSTSPPGPPVPTATPGTTALLVAAGPDAGQSSTLPAGETSFGSSAPLALTDTTISRHHLTIQAAGGLTPVVVPDARSLNGSMVTEHAPYRAEPGVPIPVRPGQLVHVGHSALTIATAPDADAALTERPDGKLGYSRSPRLKQPPAGPPAGPPAEPAARGSTPFPWPIISAPVLLGVLMFFLFGEQFQYLAFIALSPAMMIGNHLTERHRSKHAHTQELDAYHRQLAGYNEKLATAKQNALDYNRLLHPDPATLLLIAAAPSHRLWERRPTDDDFLSLRIGTATVPWLGVKLPAASDSGRPAEAEIPDLPVVLSLNKSRAVGLAGPPELTRALARSMLLSLAVLHSPHDVTITLLTAEQPAERSAADWAWLRWLPHVRPRGEAGGLARIGNDPVSIQDRISELAAVIESSRAQPAGAWQPSAAPAHVVVLDGSHRLIDEWKLTSLLAAGPAAGIFFLCLETAPTRLPSECDDSLVRILDGPSARIHAPDFDPGRPVAPDLVSALVCADAARAMAPVVDAAGHAGEGSPSTTAALPALVRFLDLAQLDLPTAQRVRAHWARSPRTARALIGQRATGPFVLDLASGPHLLVVGTTGSGKSELLQTLIASLAAANRPDVLNFALIDYKAGAAFGRFAGLPHTVGLLTNLERPQVDRAIDSLRSELERRQKILASHTDIKEYWAAIEAGRETEPLPRLVIVVDEFSAMAEEMPDRLRLLVGIGRQGRSLGIHLVLAAHKLGSEVSRDLLVNLNLKIALRVTSEEDSSAVVASKAARLIPDGSPGRAFARLGDGSLVEFQAARVNCRRPAVPPGPPPASARRVDWPDAGHRLSRPSGPDQEQDFGGRKDLDDLVAAIGAAAAQEGCLPQRPLWRDPLPRVLELDQLPGSPGTLTYGLADRPTIQEQIALTLDLALGGHLLAGGAPRSGRTTLLRTLAGSLCRDVSPDDAHLYVIDCGGGGLAALAQLPHCGAVVAADERDRASRLLERLVAQLDERNALLSASGHGDLAAYRAAQPPGQRPPYLLLLVDDYRAFQDKLEHADGNRLRVLVKDGEAAGLRIVVTGDRPLLTGPLAALVKEQIVLALATQSDYTLLGLGPAAAAKMNPRADVGLPGGRGVHLPGEDLVQIAVLSGRGGTAAENEALRRLAAGAGAPAIRPFRIEPVPAAISYREARELPADGTGIFVGVGGDDRAQIHAATPSLLTIGEPGTGRSTALAVQARSLAEAGLPLILITPRVSALPAALDQDTVLAHLAAGSSDSDLRKALSKSDRAAIVIDDATDLAGKSLGDELASRYRSLLDGGYRIIAAAATQEAQLQYGGLVAELARARSGLVLQPAGREDGAPLAPWLPESVLTSGQPGWAVLIRGKTTLVVRVPQLPGPQV